MTITNTSTEMFNTSDRVTVFVSGAFGNVVAVKSTGAKISMKAMNSFQNVMRVEVKKFRKRSKSAFGRREGELCIVVKGWNAPEPASMFGDAKRCEAGTVREQRHEIFSDAWEAEFRAQLAASDAEVMFDARA